MATWTLDSTAQGRWSWLRIGGFSGTLFVHIAALILLAIPVAMPGFQPASPTPSVIWIEAPPEPAVLPVPDEPVPLPRPRVVTVAAAAPPAVADVPVESAISEPVFPAFVESVASTTTTESAIPAGVDNASLAYETIVQPKYPIAAIRRGEEGEVLLRVSVGRDGLPMHAEVARSSGSRHLDKAALEVVMRWRFLPVRIEGTAVQATGMVPIHFALAKR